MKGYKFPVYTTESCPRNETEWDERSAVFYCQGKSSYACLPNENITELLEFCYPLPRIAIHQGKTLWKDANYKCNHLNLVFVHRWISLLDLSMHAPLNFDAQRFPCALFFYNNFHSFHYLKKSSKSVQYVVFIVNWNLICKIDVIIEIFVFWFMESTFYHQKGNLIMLKTEMKSERNMTYTARTELFTMKLFSKKCQKFK